MTRKNGSLERCRARLHDEHGFSLLETVVAIGVIFGSLLVLAYTATIGFGYESVARQRQSATGIANQAMEQVRGLAYAKVQTGMLTSDLTGDTNLVTGCSGDAVGVYRFLSCTPGEIPGSGEKIVQSSGATNPTTPLVPHVGTFTQNSTVFTTRAYVTNDCPTIDTTTCLAIDPYRVTVLVTWTSGKAPAKLVRIQSLFYSPTGCRSTDTHPFAAPCQPYFFGTATVPRGEINVTGEISGIAFQGGDLFTTGVDSSVQHEQMSQAQASYTATGVQLLESTGSSVAGGTTEVTTAADTDPGSASTLTYGSSDLSPSAAASLRSPTGGGTLEATFSTAGGDTAAARSTTAAGVVNVCPPPTDPGETDGQACAGARAQQGGNLSAVARFDGFTAALGSATLGMVAPASGSPNTTFVNHTLYPATALCSPVNGADGCVEQTAIRRLGTINIGGLPSVITPPLNWSGANPWNGYLVSIVGYQDQTSAPVGRQVLASAASGTAVPAPAASVTAGTVYYWNPVAGSYASMPATDNNFTTLLQASALSLTQVVGSHTVQVDLSIEAGTAVKATTSTTTATSGAGNLSRTEASAQVTPPKLTLRYVVWVDGNDVVDLRITVNLKTMEARGVYAPAPLAGT